VLIVLISMVLGAVALTWVGGNYLWNHPAGQDPSGTANRAGTSPQSPRPARTIGALPERSPSGYYISFDRSGCPTAWPYDQVTRSPREICPGDLGPGWTVEIAHVLDCTDSPQTASARPARFIYVRGRVTVSDVVTPVTGSGQALALVQQMHQRVLGCPGWDVGRYDAENGLLILRRTVAKAVFLIWIQAARSGIVQVSMGTTSGPAPTEHDARRVALIALRKAEESSPSPSAGGPSTTRPLSALEPKPQVVTRISFPNADADANG
jgi:hypothetical protein